MSSDQKYNEKRDFDKSSEPESSGKKSSRGSSQIFVIQKHDASNLHYDFRYAGQVGTGFDNEQLEDLHAKLSSIERKTNPFTGDKIKDSNVHFVTPKYIAEIGFTEWTNDNKLRHPRFLGLRKDKEPDQVHQEKV